MAKSIKSKIVRNVGQLKQYLEGISDKTPIRGSFGELVRADWWRREDYVSGGPKRWIEFADE